MGNTDLEREEKETGRIEAFSDGVFAIAVTLLVLDLKVPHRDSVNSGLMNILVKQWPSFLAYLISFATILIMWVNHHNLFNKVKRTDTPFMFLNGFLLFLITFVPFPTGLLAEYIQSPDATTAAAMYSGTYVMCAIAFNLIWRYASHGHKLLHKRITAAEVQSINRQYFAGPTFYGLAFILAFVNVAASVGVTIILAIFYAVTATMSRETS